MTHLQLPNEFLSLSRGSFVSPVRFGYVRPHLLDSSLVFRLHPSDSGGPAGVLGIGKADDEVGEVADELAAESVRLRLLLDKQLSEQGVLGA